MFNKKGKDILVWINCVVFVIIIGLSTFKGTLKEDFIGEIDKASGKNPPAGDPPRIPDVCNGKKEKKNDVEKLYEYYKMWNNYEVNMAFPHSNWKKMKDAIDKEKEIGHILKDIEKIKNKKKYAKTWRDNLIDKSFVYKGIIDTKTQENIAHMYCDGDVDEYPHQDYYRIRREKERCEYRGLGTWEEKGGCNCGEWSEDSVALIGKDNKGEPQTIDGVANKKFDGKIASCFCPKDNEGNETEWNGEKCIVKMDNKKD